MRLSSVTSLLTLALLALLSFCKDALGEPRDLSFYHTHTGKSLTVVYRDADTYLPDALDQIENFLKDFRSGQRHPIDPELLDVLYELKTRSGSSEPFEVISAYRSPATNTMLRNNSSGVAEGSLHLQGRAIDVRLPGVALRRLREIALELERGGVGFYPGSDFIHVDTGRVRQW
jgi:uncharacterized protein YcbK (DUF882 family)